VHLVGFAIEICYDARSYKRKKYIYIYALGGCNKNDIQMHDICNEIN
jgi:hypothetical protein